MLALRKQAKEVSRAAVANGCLPVYAIRQSRQKSPFASMALWQDCVLSRDAPTPLVVKRFGVGLRFAGCLLILFPRMLLSCHHKRGTSDLSSSVYFAVFLCSLYLGWVSMESSIFKLCMSLRRCAFCSAVEGIC